MPPTQRRPRARSVVAWVAALALAVALVAACSSKSSNGGGGSTPLGSSAPGAAASSVAPAEPIGHDGRWLTDAAGRVVLLHGVNLVAKTPGQTPAQMGFDAADAQFLKDNGFDVVRLGTTAASLMPQPGVIDQAYVDSFAQTVAMLTSHGLLVLIDLHQDGWGPTLGSDGFPGWMTITNGAQDTHTTFPLYYVTNPAIQAAFGSFWKNVAGPGGLTLQDRVGTMFEALAGPVATNPGVLGYDLINEPFPGSDYSPCLTASGCPAVEHQTLDPYYARMQQAIRTKDPEHLLFGEPFVLFNFGTGPTSIHLPGDDRSGGMSWHLYTTSPANEPAAIKYAEQWSASTGGALLNTEFGATTDVGAIDRQVDELDGALMPWIWWAFNENVVKDVAKAPTADNLDTAVVDALVRPHAVTVAGTPTASTYGEKSATFTFSYDTKAPGGTTFTCTAASGFQVPKRAYPNGYHVTVTGGAVTSPPGAPQLTVVANKGAARVTVVVAPGGATQPGKPSGC